MIDRSLDPLVCYAAPGPLTALFAGDSGREPHPAPPGHAVGSRRITRRAEVPAAHVPMMLRRA
ncbi:MAG TPA: hypothetical protein PKD46_11260 [Aggregatilineaceae bacterium]|nr:hypothetical protein [Aggregatilineaceae bacterium]